MGCHLLGGFTAEITSAELLSAVKRDTDTITG
jgi:hypothetical protein